MSRITLNPRPMQATLAEVEAGDEPHNWVTPETLSDELERQLTLPTIAGAQVQAFRLIAEAAGGAVHADPTNVAHAAVVRGVATTSAAAGEELRLAYEGEVRNPGWSFAPRAPLYLGPEGTIVEAVPAAPPLAFHLAVGLALTPDRILVRLGVPILFGD